MRLRCRFCRGFSLSGSHPACERLMQALDVDDDQMRVVLYPGEEHSITVTKAQLRGFRQRMAEEDEL